MTPPSIQLPMLDEVKGAVRELGRLLIEGPQQIALPLDAVDIVARVVDRVSEVTIKQVFKNTLTEHIEAVYIFPLAAGSAISNFEMKVGQRKIKGVVRERAEAREQYNQAVSAGKRAALLEQERDDVFTVQVGNIPPGEDVTIEISYSERLPFYEDGASELRLPLVVAPRYIPGRELNRNQVGDGISADTDLVPDASRISPPRLANGVDSNVKLSLKVEFLPVDGVEISDLACSQHASKTSLGQEGITVSLGRVDERLNRDFVLRWRATGDTVKSSLLTYKTEDGTTYGLLSLLPPRRTGYLGAPRDIIFVLDRSGSMSGIKMSSAIRACGILLNTLGPQDKFAIASFDNSVEWMPARGSDRFITADTAGLEAGEKYLRTVDARGGTEMDNALANALSALRSRTDRDGRLPSLVVLTDGEVGNESMILRRIQNEIGDARLFVVGIDTSVNSGLLKRLAALGGGTATFVEPGIQLEEALTSIGREIGAPIVTDLQLENQDLSVDRASLSPARIPDIFAGRASICFFKLNGAGSGKLRIKGRLANGKSFEEKVKAQPVDMACIAHLWAKAHIMDLEDTFRLNNSRQIKQDIISLSVQHSLLSKFTAYVVVDESEIVNKSGSIRKIVQAVETPAEWQAISPTVKMRSLSRMSSNEYSNLAGGAGGSLGASQASAQGSWGASPAPARDSWGAAAEGHSADAWTDCAEAAQEACSTGSWKQFSACNSSLSLPAPGGTPAASSAPPSPPQSPSLQQASSAPMVPPQQASMAAQPSAQPIPPVHPARPSARPMSAGRPDQKKEMFDADLSLRQLGASKKDNAVPLQKDAASGISAHEEKAKLVASESAREELKAMKLSEEASFAPTPILPLMKKQDASGGFMEKLNSFAKSILGSRDPVLDLEFQQVKSDLQHFLSEFEQAFEKVHRGEPVSADLLETARVKLVQRLATMKLGMELPELQKFLRVTAIELIASVKNTAIAPNQRLAFWTTNKFVFDSVRRELETLLSGKEAAFWDSSV